jgi:P27 family predicted phage terminase small subunit
METIKRLWPMPKNLKDYGADFYKRIGKQLISVQILTELDKESFTALCVAYHMMLAAQDGILEYGSVVKGSKDEIKKNPSFTNFKMASDIFLKLSKRFYLCPADREGLKIEKPVKANGKEKKYFS